MAKYEPNPMCAPDTMPSLNIFAHVPAAFAAPAATATKLKNDKHNVLVGHSLMTSLVSREDLICKMK